MITAFMPSRLAQPKLERLSYQPALSLVGLWDSLLLLTSVLRSAFSQAPSCRLRRTSGIARLGLRSHTVSFNVAKFCKLAPNDPIQHHDALAFPDGSTVLVNTLLALDVISVAFP